MPNFKNVDFNIDFNKFLELRKLADLEVLGDFAYEHEKIHQYIAKNLHLLGPQAFLHVYDNEQLIGQIELGSKNNGGYIHLFYIFPQFRQQGYFKLMHAQAIAILQSHNFTKIQLATPKHNTRAIEIYQYYGWLEIDNQTNKPNMVTLEKLI